MLLQYSMVQSLEPCAQCWMEQCMPLGIPSHLRHSQGCTTHTPRPRGKWSGVQLALCWQPLPFLSLHAVCKEFSVHHGEPLRKGNRMGFSLPFVGSLCRACHCMHCATNSMFTTVSHLASATQSELLQVTTCMTDVPTVSLEVVWGTMPPAAL